MYDMKTLWSSFVLLLSEPEAKSLSERYIEILVYIIESMTATGYSNNFQAVNVLEMWFAVFVMISGKMLFGLILASIAATLSNLEVEQVQYTHKLDAIRVSAQKYFFKVVYCTSFFWWSHNYRPVHKFLRLVRTMYDFADI